MPLMLRRASGSALERASPALIVSRSRPSRGRLFACAAVLLVNGLFVLNNLAPYLGLPNVGAMTMFSRLTDGSHFILPKVTLSDTGSYVSAVRVAMRGPDTAETRELQAFADWAGRHGSRINLNFLRYHVDRMCRSVPDGSVSLRLLDEAGRVRSFDNVCTEPTMRNYAVLARFAECQPGCKGVLARWAQGAAMPK
jgi:hypothetical protein